MLPVKQDIYIYIQRIYAQKHPKLCFKPDHVCISVLVYACSVGGVRHVPCVYTGILCQLTLLSDEL